jgi:hypothetical protein
LKVTGKLSLKYLLVEPSIYKEIKLFLDWDFSSSRIRVGLCVHAREPFDFSENGCPNILNSPREIPDDGWCLKNNFQPATNKL